MKRLLRILSVAMVMFVLSAVAQTTVQPTSPFPNQIVGASLNFDQAATPQVYGMAFYAHLSSANLGIFQWNAVRISSITLKPRVEIQTQTETGLCVYTFTLASFDFFSCGSAGVATAASATGVSASGTLLATKSIGKGWSVGFDVGPSYSGTDNKVAYPLGLVVMWGGK